MMKRKKLFQFKHKILKIKNKELNSHLQYATISRGSRGCVSDKAANKNMEKNANNRLEKNDIYSFLIVLSIPVKDTDKNIEENALQKEEGKRTLL